MQSERIKILLNKSEFDWIENDEKKTNILAAICKELDSLDIEFTVVDGKESLEENGIRISILETDFKEQSLQTFRFVEKIIQQIPFDFDRLPLLVEGESKVIRSLNDKIVVERFKPTVYSYTHNRYGTAKGTESLRVLFTSELFRRMNVCMEKTSVRLDNAFLACVETESGPLLVQRRVEASNLEVRVKRYHIGSPVHRYKYTDQHPTSHQCGSLKPWSRFDIPIVCFDWRHPLEDEEGNRLADEPISDDYASVWMENIPSAKTLARETFLWLEKLFGKANLILVDICFFIDRSGTTLFGEISPDCMRVREQVNNAVAVKSFDKDIWREGEKSAILSERYKKLYELVFL